MAAEGLPGAGVPTKERLRRAVHDDQLNPFGQSAEVLGQLVELLVLVPPNWKNIGSPHVSGLTAVDCG
jgi:hypothetical protein